MHYILRVPQSPICQEENGIFGDYPFFLPIFQETEQQQP
jgi:hypothetical protein